MPSLANSFSSRPFSFSTMADGVVGGPVDADFLDLRGGGAGGEREGGETGEAGDGGAAGERDHEGSPEIHGCGNAVVGPRIEPRPRRFSCIFPGLPRVTPSKLLAQIGV